ncbi:DNA-directed RNA polymerase V subunit 5A [Camellia lanceoleosa]|uniref:DNA-directed RNA polymerase V subunit 5A n=1 Tax=Camellia lanceoleosa TaxID=1840588 RepID=A0ACC0GCG3_9ERIC|nr:DNA-directed RNA polymerase V subunit 5A [Camellia lanceoleosa]
MSGSFVDEGSKESLRYYLARRTLLEMLRDRGYAVSSSDIELSSGLSLHSRPKPRHRSPSDLRLSPLRPRQQGSRHFL